MIKIKKLEIFNYRSCIKTKLEVLTDLTTLIGINGAGKSNILNSIQLLKRLKRLNRNIYLHAPELSRFKGPHTELDILFDIDKELYNLKADIYYETNEANIEEIFSSVLKISKEKSDWKDIDTDLYEFVDYLNRSQKDIDISQFDYFIKKKKIPIEDVLVYAKIIRYLADISYYSATQFSDPTKCPIALELEESRLVRPDKKSKTHEQFIYDLYRVFKKEPKLFEKYIHTVNQNGMRLIDGITFSDHNIPGNSLKVKAGGEVQKFTRNKNIVVPTIIIDGLNLSPNQLSEGTFRTLALVFYLLIDNSELLLIEEPEVCVHHGLLSSIIELIKTQSKHKQIFISTHSDYVLDQLSPEDIVLVTKNKETGTIAKALPKSLSKNDFKALKEYLKESGNLGEYWKQGGFENE